MTHCINTIRKLAGLLNESAPINFSGTSDIEKEDARLGPVLIDLADSAGNSQFANALREVGAMLKQGETNPSEISSQTGIPTELITKMVTVARTAADSDHTDSANQYYEENNKMTSIQELLKLAGLPVNENYGPTYSRFESYIPDPLDDDNSIKVVVKYSYEAGWEPSEFEAGAADVVEIEEIEDAKTGEKLYVSDEVTDELRNEAWAHLKKEQDQAYDGPMDETAIGNTLTDHNNLIQEDNNNEIAADLEEIAEQIMMLTKQALTLVRGTDEYQRARSYWYGHIMSAVGSDEYSSHGYNMVTTILALRDNGTDDEW